MNSLGIKLWLLLWVAGMSGSALAADLVKGVEIGENRVILGTGFGQSLYTFDPDQNGNSACYQACAEKWPPLLVTAEEAATLAAPYSTIRRTNGLLQVTVEGQPLYTYYLDRAQGELKGDGVGGVWHVRNAP